MDINAFQQGDFVFAKIKGHRAWPARILFPVIQPPRNRRMFKVYFYGTCDTAEVGLKHLYPFEQFKHKYGLRREEEPRKFRNAMGHANIMYDDPGVDLGFRYILFNLQSISGHTVDSDMDSDQS